MADVAKLRQILRECRTEQKESMDNPISGEIPFEISSEATTRFFSENYGVDLRAYNGWRRTHEEYDAEMKRLMTLCNIKREQSEQI